MPDPLVAVRAQQDPAIPCDEPGCPYQARWVVFFDRGGVPRPVCGHHVGGILDYAVAEVSPELRATLRGIG